MFDATRVVLEGIIEESSNHSQRGDVDAAYTHMKSFEFVFILHLMKEIMGKTNILSQELQKKSQDIGNSVELVSSTKKSLNDFRNTGWHGLIEQVKTFSEKHQIEMPDMDAPYKSTRYRPRRKDNHVNFEHFYRVDIFIFALDKQVHELTTRFSHNAMGLLTLSSTVVPKKNSEVYDIDKICTLVRKYYPSYFTEQEMIRLKYELDIFIIDKPNNPKLCGVSTLSELCRALKESRKSETYYLFDRFLRLILTLPVSTATSERAFSAMKICKNRLRNKMSNAFLGANLVVYIERELAESFDSVSIIDEFKSLKGRKAEL